jgi:hypothetical protein
MRLTATPCGRPDRLTLVLLWVLLPASPPLPAQDVLADVFPGSGFGMPMGPGGFGSLPFPDEDPLSPFADFTEPYRERAYPWPAPQTPERSGMSSPSTAYQSHQPDLTGIWRGSGGETVDIRRNRARIWNQNRQSCDCVFFFVGRRLIAYSPSSDTVRKYWFQGGQHEFRLLDEDGNLMTFQRAR